MPPPWHPRQRRSSRPANAAAAPAANSSQDGATLMDHLDVLETHVISGILHIDSSKDGPYPIQVGRER